jgi:hypothetical protein
MAKLAKLARWLRGVASSRNKWLVASWLVADSWLMHYFVLRGFVAKWLVAYVASWLRGQAAGISSSLYFVASWPKLFRWLRVAKLAKWLKWPKWLKSPGLQVNSSSLARGPAGRNSWLRALAAW